LGHDGGNDLTFGLGNIPKANEFETVENHFIDRPNFGCLTTNDTNLVIGVPIEATNLWINVRNIKGLDTDGYKKYTKMPFTDGNFLVVFAESIAEGAELAKQYFSDRSPNNIVVNVHGTSTSDPNDPNGSSSYGERAINDCEAYCISKFDIDKYRTNPSSMDELKRQEIDAIISLANMSKENLVLLACLIGTSKNMVTQLKQLYRTHITSGVDLYINADESNPAYKENTKRVIVSGNLSKTVSDGWIRINSAGAQKLIQLPGLTGNLTIDSNSLPTVRHEKISN
jgi:hypothetical protein